MSISTSIATPLSIQALFEAQSVQLKTVSASTYAIRVLKLEKLERYITSNQEEILQAIYDDLQKPRQEAILSEIVSVLSEIRYTKKHLKRWLAPQKVPTVLSTIGATSYIQYESKGQSLIIAPWNYPFCLVIKPLIFAIAAGCTVIIKPSEFTPATNQVLQKLISALFEPNEVAIIEGEVETTQALLALPFHHIFFTGSPQVGKIVMKAASEHLASVTLELGGKSPLIIDETVKIEKIVDQIIWAKFLNNGQTCIAPDYVFVHQSQYESLIQLLREHITKMYPGTIQDNSDYGRIINTKQVDRLTSLLQDATAQGANIVIGGKIDRQDRYIAPTVLTDVSPKMKVMQEEIFGPLLPIIPYKSLEQVALFIQKKPKPLALYMFSQSFENQQFILNNTSSGNVMINDVLQHFANPELPFGGVNTSGIGKSNGFYGFQQFVNAKGVMHRKFGSLSILFPPYRKEGLQGKLFQLLTKYF